MDSTLTEQLKTVGRTIRALRTDRGLSQQQLADAADLDRTYVSAIEGGKQNMSFKSLHGMANALGVTVGELVAV